MIITSVNHASPFWDCYVARPPEHPNGTFRPHPVLSPFTNSKCFTKRWFKFRGPSHRVPAGGSLWFSQPPGYSSNLSNPGGYFHPQVHHIKLNCTVRHVRFIQSPTSPNLTFQHRTDRPLIVGYRQPDDTLSECSSSPTATQNPQCRVSITYTQVIPIRS